MASAENWQRFHEAGNRAAAGGRYETALAEYIRALILARQTSDCSAQAETLRALAKIYMVLDKVNEAKQTINEALPLDISFWGEESQNVSDDNFILSEILRREGDLTTARKLCEQVLLMRIAFYGDNHQSVLEALLCLIWIGLEDGHEELVNTARHAYQISRQIYPGGLFSRELNIKALLEIYIKQERYFDVQTIYERALQLLRTVTGDRSLELAEVLNDCSVVIKNANKHLSAWRLETRSQLITDLYSLEKEADSLIHSGQILEAEACLRLLFNNLHKRVAPDRIVLSRVLKKQADVASKLGRHTDAERFRQQAYYWENPNP